MTIQFPITKTIKDAIRQEIGQTVTFVMQGDAAACEVCSGLGYYDSVNDTSLDPFCTTCSGKYWIVQDVASGIVAHVRWRTGDESDFGIAGATFTGDCTVTIDSESLSETQIAKIKEIKADGRYLEVFRMIKRGVPTRDRLRFVCREVGKE
jgi:hypothetical protein